MINRPLDMLFNAPTLSFIHTLCVLWAGSKPAYSTIINTHVFNNPTPYYRGRGPMLHNAPVNEFTGLYVWVIPGISGNRLYSIEY